MSMFLPGTQVEARGLRWEVVFGQAAGGPTLYRLRCLDGALRGEEMDFLHPFEEIVPSSRELQPRKAAPLQAWKLYHQAFLLEQALGPDALLAAQPGRLKLQPYQLVPVMRALQMGRPRLLLADGVGLGKTIQAGLVLAELIARRRAHRILIVSPAGPLLLQWQEEMLERFGLRFKVLDREALQEIRYQQELGSNPFDHVALGLISIDFAKQERVLQDLERTQYDVVIIDEAHHCASLGGDDTGDSLRRHLAELLARQSDALLLLTATPHDGHDSHFASIMELLDPSLVDGRGSLRGETFRRFIVRRLKRHIKDPETGKPLFKDRKVMQKPVAVTSATHPDFVEFQRAILALVTPRLKRALRQGRYAEVLAFLALLKRSVSTVHSCRNTLQAIADRLKEMVERGLEQHEARSQRLKLLRDYRRRIERFGVLSFDEEQDKSRMEAEDIAAEFAELRDEDLEAAEKGLLLERDRSSRRMKNVRETGEELARLLELSQKALDQDPKLEQMVDLVREIRAGEPRTNILIYTEYTDSQDVLVQALQKARADGLLTGEIRALSGDDDVTTRKQVAREFMDRDDVVLVSTDATAEGLNLQHCCHNLIHLELPYNPNRLEQRNGRIDRFGQTRDPHIHYFYLADTFEDRLLRRLVAKYEKQRDKLTFVPNTLGVAADGAGSAPVRLLAGLSDEGPMLFKTAAKPLQAVEAEPEDTDNAAYRDLLSEVDKAFSKFSSSAESNSWLGNAGLNAEETLVQEASKATTAGTGQSGVELLGFVKSAIRLDSGGQAVRETLDGIVELKLDRTWTYGLDDIPGWNDSEGMLRVSSRMDLSRDSTGRPLGFLGRAHPIVRRAIERVRNIRYGTDEGGLDRRVSAVQGTSGEPELLLTFLGTVESGNGREFERVVAVRVLQHGQAEVIVEPARWIGELEQSRAVSTAGIFEARFESWEEIGRAHALAAATSEFASLAASFREDHDARIGRERLMLDAWLQARMDLLCGKPSAAPAADLFAQKKETTATWRKEGPPLGRLASYAADRDEPPSQRAEARNAIALYEKRVQDLDRSAEMKPPSLSLIGMLMLVPADANEVRS
jgi:superfamily II DNA or RNA helicase